MQELLLRVRDDTAKPEDGRARGKRRDSEIRIRKDSAWLFSSFSFFLDKASQDRKRQKEGEKKEEVEEEEEEEEGSPEALIVSEFRVDGNPRAVLHPPAFLPRSLNIRTRLSYVTAAKEEEQKYENARKTGQAIRKRERKRKRGRREKEKEIAEVRSLKRSSVCSKQIELLRF